MLDILTDFCVNFTAGSTARIQSPIQSFVVAPNPSKALFNVTFTSEEAQTIQLQVLNVLGEKVYEESLIEFNGLYSNTIDLATKPKGVYFLQLITLEGEISKKLVLQ